MNPLDFFIPVAHAQAVNPAGPGGGLSTFILPIVMLAVVFFLMILPQNKRTKQHREMLAKLQKGDEVVTNGGLAGRVTDLGDAFVTIEISNGVNAKFQRAAIAMVLPKGSLKAS